MSIFTKIAHTVTSAAGHALEKATGGVIPARVITTPSDKPKAAPTGGTGATPPLAAEGTIPITGGGEQAFVGETGETTTFTVAWSTLLLIAVAGMLLGMVFRKKY